MFTEPRMREPIQRLLQRMLIEEPDPIRAGEDRVTEDSLNKTYRWLRIEFGVRGA